MDQPQFMPPFFMIQGPPTELRERPELEVPARVRVAMGVLSFLSDKTATKLAASNVGFQELEGQKLQPEEQELLYTACKELTQYIDGSSKPSTIEKLALERHKTDVARRSLADSLKIVCPACESVPMRMNICSLCKGKGSVTIIRD